MIVGAWSMPVALWQQYEYYYFIIIIIIIINGLSSLKLLGYCSSSRILGEGRFRNRSAGL